MSLAKKTEGHFKLLGLNTFHPNKMKGWLSDLTIGNVYYKEIGRPGFDVPGFQPKADWAGYSWERVATPVVEKEDEVKELSVPGGTEVVTDGLKNDFGKVLMSLLFTGCPEALAGAAGVLTFGAQKYEAHSWKQVDAARYLDAFYRHMYKCHIGEELDPDSGLMHIDHALTNLLFIRELMAGGDNPFASE